jgi:hypothetical protein
VEDFQVAASSSDVCSSSKLPERNKETRRFFMFNRETKGLEQYYPVENLEELHPRSASAEVENEEVSTLKVEKKVTRAQEEVVQISIEDSVWLQALFEDLPEEEEKELYVFG